MKPTLALLAALLLAPLAAFSAAENNVLPDGTVFRSWEQPRRYSETYHVAQGEPQASDETGYGGSALADHRQGRGHAPAR